MDLNQSERFLAFQHLLEGYYQFAKFIHCSHMSGFPDWRDAFTTKTGLVMQGIFEITQQFGDAEMNSLVYSFYEGISCLLSLDRQIVNWLIDFTHLRLVKDPKRRLRILEKRLYAIISSVDSGTQGPTWIEQPEYQVLVKKSTEIMAEIENTWQQMQRHIEYMLDNLSEQ